MLWTQSHIPTLKEVPQDAEIASHQLMLRAGLIRRLGSGLYTFLPLGFRALRKVEAIVREEMDRAGALEVLMPAMHPREIWDRSGRYESLKNVMFRIKDRQDRELVLGPTHEEIITDLVAREINSYKQLPCNFYQIQTKFRDEIRPRFGLMRGKEFIMKDAYSFDVSSEAADESYAKMYQAYVNIFRRCGLHAMPVDADTGDMGGSSSHEFMVPSDSGEDAILEADDGSYAANLERAEGFCDLPNEFPGADNPLEEVDTPNVGKIEDVATFLNVEKRQLVKTILYLADDKPVAVLLPGDREINEIKLKKIVNAETLEPADPETIRKVTSAEVGFAGPVGLDIPQFADRTLEGLRGGVTGANKTDTHLKNFDLARDTTITEFHDIACAKAGDLAPNRKGRFIEKRGVEVGHVFKLGTKYSVALGANFLDENGKSHPMVMGCYGIGVSRTLQAIIEQSHDENGIIWPASVAPYTVLITVLNPKDEASMNEATQLADTLEAQGVDVIVDDRKERPGFKFKDADLLGFPLRVTIGERGLAKGVVELKPRTASDFQEVPVREAAETVLAAVRELREALK
ncbi:MAG: proline--tRNA ligase [Verrucomicrobia bacterium]|nr:proline--tRNA ligase [Verrucomicrobiota bacterium]MCH8513566.1 proline--tRNA ligase [Kiritimatiellia bacterium]